MGTTVGGPASSAEIEHEPARWRRPASAAVCTGVLGGLWVAFVETLLRSAGWIAGTQAPALATSDARLRLAIPVVALGVGASWTLARSPLHGPLARVAALAAAGAQLVAVLLVLARGASDTEPVPDVAWYLAVMLGGIAGAALVGVAVTRAGPGAGPGALVVCIGWAWLTVAGAHGLAVHTCVGGKLLQLAQPYTGGAAVGVVLVVLGAVSIWREADGGGRVQLFWQWAAIATVLIAFGFTFALLRLPAKVIGGCEILIS